MAGSVNKVILIGNLGKDPEVRSGQDGKKFGNFTLATSETWKDRNTGEKREKTEWHRVVIYNDRLADFAEKYLKKGNKVYVEGQLTTREWNDKDGQKRYTTEIVISQFKGELTSLSSASGSGGGGSYGNSGGGGGSGGGYSSGGGDYDSASATGGNGGGGRASAPADLDDDIPF